MENNNAPILILYVQNQPYLSIAKMFGRITFKNKRYTYLPEHDALLRDVWMKKYEKHKNEGNSWQDFLQIVEKAEKE